MYSFAEDTLSITMWKRFVPSCSLHDRSFRLGQAKVKVKEQCLTPKQSGCRTAFRFFFGFLVALFQVFAKRAGRM